MREDMTKLRRSIAEGAEDSENEAVREMADQYEVVQEELDRVKAECLQLRAVLANVQLSGEHDQVFVCIHNVFSKARFFRIGESPIKRQC